MYKSLIHINQLNINMVINIGNKYAFILLGITDNILNSFYLTNN